MIVIEGADLVGKTTLAQALFEHIPGECHVPVMPRHFTKVPDNFDPYWGYANCCQRDVILDRFHMSQIAYREVDGERHDLTPYKYRLVDAKIEQHGGIVVLMTASPELIRERFEKKHPDRKEMYQLGHIFKVNEVFMKIGKDRGLWHRSAWYSCRVDVHLCVNDAFSVANAVEQVVELWRGKQSQVTGLLLEQQRRGTLHL